MPVTASVTGCSTWSRVFISMKKKLSGVSGLRRVGDELHRPRPLVADGRGGLHRHRAERMARLVGKSGRRRLLDHLLMPALHRAVALEEMHDIAVPVGEDLHLDVARRLDVALKQHLVVAEGGKRLALRARQRVVEVDDRPTRRMPRPPPPATALISTG